MTGNVTEEDWEWINELYAERDRLLDLLKPFVGGFAAAPAAGDLDDEQHIIVHATLGDWRKARAAIRPRISRRERRLTRFLIGAERLAAGRQPSPWRKERIEPQENLVTAFSRALAALDKARRASLTHENAMNNWATSGQMAIDYYRVRIAEQRVADAKRQLTNQPMEAE